MFEEIAFEIRTLLGGLVQEIHHIGSTAVPGLCAKPRIDVDVVVCGASDIPEAIDRMSAAGYEVRGNRYNDGMWAFTEPRGGHPQRVYICAPDTPTHLNRILLRDYLRGHPNAAAAYAALKWRFAVAYAGDGDGYTRAKGPFVAEVVRLAAQPCLDRLRIRRRPAIRT